MRTFVLALALFAVAGCMHRARVIEEPVASVAPVIGQTHEPYRGKPHYLAAARPLQQVARPATPNDNPCAQRSRVCDDRLRALLAAIDGQVLALTTPPSEKALQALKVSLDEMLPLLAPYTDVTAEADELGQTVDRLPAATEVDQGALRQRMTQLTDLIRVQLAAAQ